MLVGNQVRVAFATLAAATLAIPVSTPGRPTRVSACWCTGPS